MKPRLVFMGSPAAAVPSLRAAARLGDVVGVFSQPDRPAGRGRRSQPPPVALAAVELGLPLHQPPGIRTPEVAALLAAASPDVILVVAYGRILPASILRAAPRGCVNVHFSLLPRHRGAAPVAHAVLAGDERTGVSLMVLDEGMDTGPVLVQREVAIAHALSLLASCLAAPDDLHPATATAIPDPSVCANRRRPSLPFSLLIDLPASS